MKKTLFGISGTAILGIAVFFLWEIPFRQLFPIRTIRHAVSRLLEPKSVFESQQQNESWAYRPRPLLEDGVFMSQYALIRLPSNSWKCEAVTEGSCHRFECSDSSPSAQRKASISAHAQIKKESHDKTILLEEVYLMDCGPNRTTMETAPSKERDINGHLWIERHMSGWPSSKDHTHVFFTKEADVWVQVEMTVDSLDENTFSEVFKQPLESLRPFRRHGME